MTLENLMVLQDLRLALQTKDPMLMDCCVVWAEGHVTDSGYFSASLVTRLTFLSLLSD